jgi:hypothetical protein
MQHAFAGGALHQGLFSDMERQALAVTGSGDIVWDWDVAARPRHHQARHQPSSSALRRKQSARAARNWLPVLHSDDRDRSARPST